MTDLTDHVWFELTLAGYPPDIYPGNIPRKYNKPGHKLYLYRNNDFRVYFQGNPGQIVAYLRGYPGNISYILTQL